MNMKPSHHPAPAVASRPRSKRGLLMLALEPRLMFDGAVVATAAVADTHVDVARDTSATRSDAAAPATPAAAERPVAEQSAAVSGRQVVFIDSGVRDYQSLVSQMPPGTEVVMLDGRGDGLAQIARWAQSHSGYSAIHILSHGTEGNLLLGTQTLNGANMASHQAALSTIGQALSANGDILLYGCNIAAGQAGATFVDSLARYTQADVAASTDMTGASSLGGDWVLERSSGHIDVAGLRPAYSYLLAQPVNGTTTFDNVSNGPYLAIGGSYGAGLTASNVEGWNVLLKSAAATNCYISAEAMTGQTLMISGGSNDGMPLAYMSLSANNGYLFDLAQVDVAIAGPSVGSSGVVRLVGYRDGVAVSGAILSLMLTDTNLGGLLISFNVSGNDAFKGIDSFRIQADGSYQVTGAFGVDNVTATNFRAPTVAPVLTPSGGSSAYSGGTGNAVTVDSGMIVTDTDSATQASATVAITGNFRSGEDLLAFSNSNSVTFGNISASYNSSTGILTMTSSGATATLAQWQAALRAVTYQDTSLSPNTATRTISFTVNDGGNDSTTVTRNVTVAANVAPVIGNLNGDNPTFTEKGGAVKLDTGSAVTVTDSDSPDFTGGNVTVRITANGQGQDALGIDTGGTVALSSGTSVGSVVTVGGVAIGVIAGDGVSGHDLVITFNSNATPARVSILVAALTFNNGSSDPGTASRTVNVSVNDGHGASSSGNVAVSVAAVNDAPTATATGRNPAFTIGDAAVQVFSGASFSTVEAGQSLLQLTLTVSGLHDGSSEILTIDGSSVALTNGNTLTSAGNGLSISVSVSGGVATVTIVSSGMSGATASSVVNGMTYRDSSSSAIGGSRVVTLTSVRDSGGTSNGGVDTTSLAVASSIMVGVVPVVSVSGGSSAFTAGDNMASTPVAVDSGMTVTDTASSTLASATVSITGNFHAGEDILAFSNGNSSLYGNIVASYNNGTGVLTMTSSGATATLAQWQAALRAVTYTDSAVTPNTATRTISFQVNDGSASSTTVSRTLTVTAVDQTPVATGSGGSAAFTAGDNTVSTPVVVDSGITVSDLDNSTLASATVSITGNFHSGEDILAFSNTSAIAFGNIVASYNSGTGVLTMTSSGATATLAQWQAALRAVTYTDSAVTPNSATRTISFSVSDGSKSSAVVSRSVTVAAVDQTPVTTTSGGSAAFAAGDNTASTPVVVDSGITVSDLDNSTLASATVSITGNFHSGEDVLAFSNGNASLYGNISASYDSSTGVLTLTSSGATATLAQWQAALRAVTYTDSAVTPNTATRTISFAVNDGSKDSAAVSRTVTVAATDQTPIATATAGSGSYPVGGTPTPVVVDSGITLSDRDSSTLASATVAITGNFRSGQDVLAFSNGNASLYGNISASYNSSTGVLTLTSGGATATLAQWQAALQAVTYNNSSTSPDTASRTVSIRVNDGSKDSAAVTRVIAMQLSAPTVDGLTAGTDTGRSQSDGVTSNNTPTLSGTAIPNSLVTIYVDGVPVDGTVADSAGVWHYSFVSSLADGVHDITAMTSSGAVSSGLSLVCRVTIDTSAPSAPSGVALSTATDSGSSHSDGVTRINQPTLVGTAEAGSTVAVYVDGVQVGTTTADGSGAWRYALTSALADGDHSVRATGTDAAGNTGALSSALTLTIDTVTPAVQQVTLLDAQPVSGNRAAYSVAFSKPVDMLTSADLSILTSGTAHGSILSITRSSPTTFIVQLGDVGGNGNLSLVIKSGAAADLAGNTLSQPVTAPAYQVSTPSTDLAPIMPSSPPTRPGGDGHPAPAVVVAPITPNIVLATTAGGTSAGSLPSIASWDAPVQDAGGYRAFGQPRQFGLDHFAMPALTGDGERTGGRSGLSGFVSAGLDARAPVLRIVPDLGVLSVQADQSFSVQLPAGTVVARDPGGLTIQVRQSNGQPLPPWLHFDPATGTFSGKPPAGWNRTLSLEVSVFDKDGHRGQARLQLQFGQRLASAEAPAAEPAARGKPALSEQFARARVATAPDWQAPATLPEPA
ncbi:DUF4347 domain-containing protein [Microvirgula aerodenitrificans]|uniref:DUF4347 domain-containing protein n=1 Tax=Microvirgula aerodenitrificans TaxID=57480 RepID=UPI002F3F8147